MKTMLKRLLAEAFVITMFLFPAALIAQESTPPAQNGSAGYNSAIGVRFGTDFGITAKTALRRGYIEGILGTGYRAFIITGLYERESSAFNTANFHWYYGAGAHIGVFDHLAYYNYYYDRFGNLHTDYVYGYAGPTFGVDGIFGLEYRFPEIPFAASVDLKPYIDLYRYGYGYIDGALSFRYVF